MKKQNWEIGDIFLVKLKDGKFVIGQIIGREAQVLNSVSCAFYDLAVLDSIDNETCGNLTVDVVFAILFVTRDLLDSGRWKVAGTCPISIQKDLFPYEHLRQKGFVGAKVIGSRNVEEFLNAFFGLSPWDDWNDPSYLDKLLITQEKKPTHRLIYKAKR